VLTTRLWLVKVLEETTTRFDTVPPASTPHRCFYPTALFEPSSAASPFTPQIQLFLHPNPPADQGRGATFLGNMRDSARKIFSTRLHFGTPIFPTMLPSAGARERLVRAYLFTHMLSAIHDDGGGALSGYCSVQ
jgi:hypothetical protein